MKTIGDVIVSESLSLGSITQYCGVSSSYEEEILRAFRVGEEPIAACKHLRERWLNLAKADLEETMLLAGYPPVWFDATLAHLRQNLVDQIQGDDYFGFVNSAKELLVLLVDQIRDMFQNSPAHKILIAKMAGEPIQWDSL
jgi:hypothetical protein